MIDTHCHLNFESYDTDRDEILARAQEAGVDRIIIPSIETTTCQDVLNLAHAHEGIYAAVGVHPNDTANFNEATLQAVDDFSHQAKVVAIGEIGLDYHWDDSPKDRQHAALEAQLTLAAQRELPVIIHNRESSEDIMDVLEAWIPMLPASLQARPGVLHSFSAPPEIADRALEAGFYLGFTGPITFKKADELRSIAARVPLDRILVETDGPFLTPHPYRGKRNEPSYIPYMVERLASLHRITTEEMASITTENAERLFNLPST
ncbi:TatD family hydrolase [Phototrophicus methaneseepsis]|uniref:TatD family hydrolase n=1 Tax=Phototrophicus methaneseepsis TaxID=2710758 RepID=A0A7S8ID11_9CHLR|nr:TatD family hydrolase [Phototrophicus methaneseepsis]QPC80879.1 TatD family hydrolase [Phototrophicus methaneseepsis]